MHAEATTPCSTSARRSRRSSGKSDADLRALGKCIRECATPTASIASILRVLEVELGCPLTGTALHEVRVLIAASGLRSRTLPVTHQRSPQAALIADALCVGALPADMYASYLSGEHDSGWVVERVLGLYRENARYWRQWTIPWSVARDTLDHDYWRCALAAWGGCSGDMEIDHFLPLAVGGLGATYHDNLWTLCEGHNGPRGKWADPPDERAERAFAATGRSLPSAYVEMLSARPWRKSRVSTRRPG